MSTQLLRIYTKLHGSVSILALICLGLLTAGSISAEVRVWTDSTGKHTTEAEFVSYKDGKVTLRKPGTTKTLTLPLEKLSDEDQVFVEDLAEAMKAEAEERANREAQADTDSTDQSESDSNPAANRPRSAPNNVINSVRGAAYRAETRNKLRNLGLAMANYESSRRRFPASGTQVKGKPGLSWRVAILPYIEENALYRQFRLNEPWDSEHNLKLVDRMPKLFVSPGSDLPDGYTNFQAVVSDEAIIMPVGLRGIGIRNIRDGTSNTLLLVEVDDTEATIWTKPDDYEWDKQNPAAGIGHIWPGSFQGVMADGSVHQISLSVGNDTLNALMTRGGGERVRLD